MIAPGRLALARGEVFNVVFGEGNRGSVYHRARQVASGRFVIVGDGMNLMSMSYVDGGAACLEWDLALAPGRHVFHHDDRPDDDRRTAACGPRVRS